MYRIEASCRKHSDFHDQLVKLMRKHKWNIAVVNNVCFINVEYTNMSEAKLSKQLLQTDIHALERKMKPALPFALIFSNAFWVGLHKENER